MESTDEGVVCMTGLVCALIIQQLFSPHIYIKIQKGVSCVRSDDTKGMKGAVLGWITPQDAPLNPPLACNIQTNRGYHHPITGALLCPTGIDWNDPGYVTLTSGIYDLEQSSSDSPTRVRAKLASGEMAVSGDQWLMLVYANQEYNPDNPWSRLFRSQLLIYVSVVHICIANLCPRHSSISLHHPVL
jgi:hypothetical protein